MSNKYNKLVLGTFNSEYYWKDKDVSNLPCFEDANADLLLSSMDELLFVFCDSPEDILITKFPFNKALIDYLNFIGFEFKSKSPVHLNLENCNKNIFSLLLDNEKETHRDIFKNEFEVLPYSVIPDTELFFRKNNIKTKIPGINIVKEVNSKAYSHYISEKVYKNYEGLITSSIEELEINGLKLLKKGPFMIKETMGVSGKGNIAVTSEKLLYRIIRHIAKQQENGKSVQLICEPLYEKKLDFSCQIEIKKDKTFEFISLQQMNNNGFAFNSIQTLENELIRNTLNFNSYFEKIELVTEELIHKGYFGPVCIDSMILKDNTIVPVVEINARQSMGLINYYTDRFLLKNNTKGKLLFFMLSFKEKTGFDIILEKLESSNLLYSNKNLYGVLPLTSNTLYINYDYCGDKNDIYKGRLYFSVISRSIDEEIRIINNTKEVLKDLNMMILN